MAQPLLRDCLQYQENVLENSKTDQKRGKYAPFRPVYACITIFIARESNILEKSPKICRLKNIRSSGLKNQRLRR